MVRVTSARAPAGASFHPVSLSIPAASSSRGRENFFGGPAFAFGSSALASSPSAFSPERSYSCCTSKRTVLAARRACRVSGPTSGGVCARSGAAASNRVRPQTRPDIPECLIMSGSGEAVGLHRARRGFLRAEAERLLEPAPRLAQPDITRAGDAVGLREKFLVPDIARPQQEHRLVLVCLPVGGKHI